MTNQDMLFEDIKFQKLMDKISDFRDLLAAFSKINKIQVRDIARLTKENEKLKELLKKKK
ncbi:MAG: hypothetical protein V1858_02065 [Candidatus Gottesmanbacteria bacterium]